MRNKLLALASLLIMVACNNEQKILVLYYSQTGNTRTVAESIQSMTGADIYAFDVTEAYGGSYDETIQRCRKERKEGYVPALAPLGCDISKYDVIFLGYPIWFGTYAPPVKALLSSVSLDGKVIVPFCTFGSGGLKSSIADLKGALANADIREGYGIRAARIDEVNSELERFLIEQGWVEGCVEPLPEFSEQKPVNEEEKAVFDAACSSYQFPLGTPVTAGSREIPGGTEYLFKAESPRMDGGMTESTIYVTVVPGCDPVFTQVVR